MTNLIETDIMFRRWSAPSAKAVLLLVHGLGAHSARWDFLAGFFADQGFSSYALELRGFGQTKERPRGHIDSFRVYDRDILRLREIIEREEPGRPIFLVGESMGALIAFNLAGLVPKKFGGLVLISPAFKNGIKFPLSTYVTLITNVLVHPKKTIAIPFTSAMCTRDIAYCGLMDRSPDELREASVKLLMNIMGAQRAARTLANKLVIPTLFLVAGQDALVDTSAERKMFERLTLQDKALRDYPEMRHALSIELDRERVFRDILDWIEKKS
jgi:alpha-beta hydrolase superfamily lysophospholipase